MTKTVLITGTSTGIGRSTCELFAERGWHVLAGSRHTETLSFAHSGIDPMLIDTGDPASIDRCFGDPRMADLDCVVNNAGLGLLLPFEDTADEQIGEIFRVNVGGVLRVSRHAAGIFREKRSGTIVNISSVLGRIGVLWYSVYCATKWAVEGFSESLAHELRPFGVRVKIVEPGGTKTEFHSHAYDTRHLRITDAYRERYERKRASYAQSQQQYDTPEEVASVIVEAAMDPSWQLRYPLSEAKTVARTRRLLGDEGLWRVLFRKLGSG